MKKKAIIAIALVSLTTASLPSCSKRESVLSSDFRIKTESNTTPPYGFFVRKAGNSGWGQDLPPMF